MRHPEHTPPATPAAHGQSTPAERIEAVAELRTSQRPEYTGPTLPVAVEGVIGVQERPAQSWQPNTLPVPVYGTAGLAPVLLVGRQDLRNRVTIRNTGASTIYLGPRQDVTPSNGYALPAGSTMELHTRAEVWAIADASTPTITTSAGSALAGAADTNFTLPAGTTAVDGFDIGYAAPGSGVMSNPVLSGVASGNLTFAYRVTTGGLIVQQRFPRSLVVPAGSTANLLVPQIVSGPAYWVVMYGAGAANTGGLATVTSEYL